jgi:hypothetical protein
MRAQAAAMAAGPFAAMKDDGGAVMPRHIGVGPVDHRLETPVP